MKIIKQGTVPNIVWYGICNYCASEMETDNDNEVTGLSDCRDGTTWHTAICPVCNKKFYMKKIDKNTNKPV